jgi:hypothetical protein
VGAIYIIVGSVMWWVKGVRRRAPGSRQIEP